MNASGDMRQQSDTDNADIDQALGALLRVIEQEAVPLALIELGTAIDDKLMLPLHQAAVAPETMAPQLKR